MKQQRIQKFKYHYTLNNLLDHCYNVNNNIRYSNHIEIEPGFYHTPHTHFKAKKEDIES